PKSQPTIRSLSVIQSWDRGNRIDNADPILAPAEQRDTDIAAQAQGAFGPQCHRPLIGCCPIRDHTTNRRPTGSDPHGGTPTSSSDRTGADCADPGPDYEHRAPEDSHPIA